jgi:NADH-quinone oxidoreductase subunit F
MDLRLHDAEPTAAEREAVDAVLGPPPSPWEGAVRNPAGERIARGGHAARARRHLLLPTLHAVQAGVGWISPGALDYVCRRLTVPPADAYGVASFYALFSLAPRPPVVAHVCTDIACMCCGSNELQETLRETVGPPGEHPGDGRAIWLESPCLGLCERAPAALVTVAGPEPRETTIAPATAADIAGALAGGEAPAPPPVTIPQRPERAADLRLLRRVGVVDPSSLDSYRSHGGYAALRRAFQLGPAGVIREVVDSKLLGRGGAAFPTGRKWDAVARHPVHPHYLVCNADESEPGTFKDRIVMEHDPFALVEAMTIAGYATGAEHGYLYLRGEYPLAWDRLVEAVTQARARGFLGGDVMGTGVRFDIELRKGAGAYICGEETALFNSLEGYRGEPRNKPPFPVDQGLFGKPTVVNNVESLINVLDIVIEGGAAYASIGTGDSTGTRLFCLCGRVERPGLYEAPFGITLGELLALAGGVTGGRELRSLLLGGAAGVFVGPDQLELELSFEATRAAGATLGSGVVMVLDDTVELAPILLRIAAFFRDESCGQCVPCRVGTVRQQEALLRLASGRPRGSAEEEVALLTEITQAMRDASICGLGQTAANAIDSAIRGLRPFRTEEVT